MELFNLYKYLHPDRIDVLKNRKIRFSQPDALNDPFEFNPHLKGALSLEGALSLYPEEKRRELLLEGYFKNLEKTLSVELIQSTKSEFLELFEAFLN